DPNKRLSAEDALKHPFFDKINMPQSQKLIMMITPFEKEKDNNNGNVSGQQPRRDIQCPVPYKKEIEIYYLPINDICRLVFGSLHKQRIQAYCPQAQQQPWQRNTFIRWTILHSLAKPVQYQYQPQYPQPQSIYQSPIPPPPPHFYHSSEQFYSQPQQYLQPQPGIMIPNIQGSLSTISTTSQRSGGSIESTKSYYYEEDDIPQPNNPRFDPSLTTIESRHQQSDNRIFVSNTSETKVSLYYQGESSDKIQPNNLKFDPSLKTLANINPLLIGIASPDSGSQYSASHASTSGGSGETSNSQNQSLSIGTTPNISPKAQTKVQIIRNDHPRENTGDDINEYEIEDGQMINGNINKPSPKLLTQMLPQVPYEYQQPPNQTDIPPHNTKSQTIPLPIPKAQIRENDNKPPEKQ
ncbi:MAG: hypothetical protein EZS28_030441, partial [Streblomastix strix]